MVFKSRISLNVSKKGKERLDINGKIGTEQNLSQMEKEALRERMLKEDIQYVKNWIQAELRVEQRRGQELEDCSREIFFELRAEIAAWKGQVTNLENQAKQHLKFMEDDDTFWKD
ncbi:hypothetical protein CR513_31861, partial [Mucuna pruriens]